jgi:hypothetical protein
MLSRFLFGQMEHLREDVVAGGVERRTARSMRRSNGTPDCVSGHKRASFRI